MDEDISLWARVQILDKKLDCLIDLLGLNGELTKCALLGVAKNRSQYDRVSELYEGHWREAVNKCAEEIDKLIGESKYEFPFRSMTVKEAQELNEAARRTCEFEATSEVGDEA